MSRRAFFVLGAEGSGTNMLAEALVLAGCYEDPRHRVYMDDYEFEKMPDLLMFRRSLPHAHRWPQLKNLRCLMEEAGYQIIPLLMVRDWYCTINSVIRRTEPVDVVGQMIRTEGNMRNAMSLVSEIFCNELIYISYESFCLHPEFRRWLFVERLGLKESTIKVSYANVKYFSIMQQGGILK